MSLKSAPYYWLECDECQERSTEGGDYTAWGDAGYAVDSATDSDWIVTKDGRHYCDECRRKLVECVICDERDPVKPEDAEAAGYAKDADDEWVCKDCSALLKSAGVA